MVKVTLLVMVLNQNRLNFQVLIASLIAAVISAADIAVLLVSKRRFAIAVLIVANVTVVTVIINRHSLLKG